MGWITDKENGLLTKINGGSTGILAITEDTKRVEQFIQFFSQTETEIIRGDFLKLPNRVLIADEWHGMRYAQMVSRGYNYAIEYSEINTEKDLFSQIQNTANFDLKKIDAIMRENTTIVGIIITRPNERLDLFLNAIVDDDEIFARGSFIVVFAPEKTYFSQSTLSKVAVINIPASTEEERREYITTQVKNAGLSLSEQEIEEIVTITAGMTLKQLEVTLMESIIIHRTFDKDYIRKAKTELINKTDLVQVEMNMKHGFERIGGYEPLKQFFRENVIDVIQNKEEAEKYGLRIPKGVLIFGQAGTGKTVFAKALAKELSLPFIYLDPSNIFRSLVGESEQRMRKIIKLIDEMSPCVVFIDEIDSIGMSRDATALDSGATRKVFSILLSYLASERNNIIIGTTNRPQDLDEAFRRVGRFDYIVFSPLPDREARKEILKVHTTIVRKVPAELTGDEMEYIAEKTEWFNGAEIENLVIRASQLAFKERAGKVTMKHFREALDSIRIDIEERKKTEEKYIELAKKLVNDVTFIEKLKKVRVISSRMNYITGGGF